MKPYYQRGNITLYHAPYEEIAPRLADVKLVLADPPYGNDYRPATDNSDKRLARIVPYERVIGDDQPFDPSFLLSTFLNPTQLVLWGANHYASKLPDRSGWLSWEKIGAGAGSDLSDIELAWTSRQMPARRFHHLWRGMVKASERGIQRVHPNQKPVALFDWCIDIMRHTEGLVFDPFFGSDACGKACFYRGLPYVGTEVHEPYCELFAQWCETEFESSLFAESEPEQLRLVS